jgi:hypothetical protein
MGFCMLKAHHSSLKHGPINGPPRWRQCSTGHAAVRITVSEGSYSCNHPMFRSMAVMSVSTCSHVSLALEMLQFGPLP